MLNSLSKVGLGFIVSLLPISIHAQCNGHLELCDRTYDQVAFLTTHNAFNAGDNGFSLPNQTHGLTQQLEDGVRGLMLDVYDEAGVATVYHGFSFLGSATLASDLIQVKDFMDANPNEVVTIIFECYVSAALMNDVFTEVGLLSYLHIQTLGQAWPTLQEMTDSGKRLVVLSDKSDALSGQDWYHYVWDFAVETNFTNNSPNDFICDFNRGDASNDLFIVNHFVTDANFGTGQPDQAAIVNELSFFYDRVHGCQLEKQKFPNFPTVDFYELGQTLAVVDSLNGVATSVGVEETMMGLKVSVSPNPSASMFLVNIEEQVGQFSYSILNTEGKSIRIGSFSNPLSLDLSDEPKGIYYLSLFSDHGMIMRKLVKL